jgi:hypothetical protein
MEESSTNNITLFDTIELDIIIEVVVKEESEQQHCVDVDENEF